MTTQPTNQARLDFVLEWVLVNAAGFTLAGVALSFFGWLPLIFIGAFLGPVIGWGITGAAVGVIIGVAQWLILRHHLHQPARWISTSAIGWAIAAVALWSGKVTGMTDTGFVGFRNDASGIVWGLVGAIFGFASGTAQLFVLPLPTQRISWWLLLNTFGWAVALVIGWSAYAFLLGPIGLGFVQK